MASTSDRTAQACLITSFFKSPPKDAEDDDPQPSLPTVGHHAHSPPPLAVQDTPSCDGVCQPAVSDTLLSLDDDDVDSNKGKPLVVNLCGLLSNNVMTTLGRHGRRISLSKRKNKEQPRKSNQGLLTTPPGSSSLPSHTSSAVANGGHHVGHQQDREGEADDAAMVHCSNQTEEGQEADVAVKNESLPTVSLKQSDDNLPMMVASQSGVPSPPGGEEILPEVQSVASGASGTSDVVDKRQERLMWCCENGALNIVRTLPSDKHKDDGKQHSLQLVNKQTCKQDRQQALRLVDKQELEQTKQQRSYRQINEEDKREDQQHSPKLVNKQQDDKRKQQQEQPGTEGSAGTSGHPVVVKSGNCAVVGVTSEDSDNIVENCRTRLRRRRTQRKGLIVKDNTVDSESEESPPCPASSDGHPQPLTRGRAAKRSARSVVEIKKKLKNKDLHPHQTPVNGIEPLTGCPGTAPTSEEVTLISEEDSCCEERNALVIVSSSSSPGSNSPAVPSENNVSKQISSSGVLSADWAKIFHQPRKPVTSESRVEATEISSVSTEDEAKSTLSPKPQRSKYKKRSLSNSPLRRCRSRSRHGSRSPGSRIPLRHPSPLHLSSPRRKRNIRQSPLKASVTSARRLAFSPQKSRDKDYAQRTFDCAPYNRLNHVRQMDRDDAFWHLPPPPPHSLRASRARYAGVAMETCTRCRSSESLGLCEFDEHGSRKTNRRTPPVSGMCEDEYLAQLQNSYPGEKVTAIFDRYKKLLVQGGEKTDRVVETVSRTKNVEPVDRRQSKGKKVSGQRRTRVAGKQMLVSVRVCECDRLTGRIKVDRGAYGRRSSRLSRTRRHTSVENLPESAEPVRTESNTLQADARCVSQLPSCPLPVLTELWTEVYKPQASSEVIGNSSNVQQLLTWLRKWQKEKSDQQRIEKGQVSSKPDPSVSTSLRTESSRGGQRSSSAGRTRVPTWLRESDDDDDFVSVAHVKSRRETGRCRLDSSDSNEDEEEQELLCPVMLLCGDHGCGKTAAVYACARELGYKVFEVNSTTVRSRQNLLNSLREATLSHQVVTRPATGAIASFFKPNNADKKPALGAVKPDKPVSGGLHSFFKPKGKEKVVNGVAVEESKKRTREKGPGSEEKQEERRKQKKRRKSRSVTTISSDEEPVTVSSVSAGRRDAGSSAACEDTNGTVSSGVMLAASTVILLEEVDVLFEEEKGFWSVVYDIIETTKRPIVMTCTDHRYELLCEHKKLMFTQPSPLELSLHMQLLSLSHGYQMTAETANQIAVFLDCDIRKVFNCLQFWLLSRFPEAPVGVAPPTNCPEGMKTPSQNISSSSLCLSKLLGVKLKELLENRAHSSEEIEMIRSAGVDLVHPIATLASQSGTNCTGTSPEYSGLESCLGTPWRTTPVSTNSSSAYRSLDFTSNLCEDLSYLDMVAKGSHDSHVMSGDPWWACQAKTGLSEELGVVSGSVREGRRITAVMEALVRNRVSWEDDKDGSSHQSRLDVCSLMEGDKDGSSHQSCLDVCSLMEQRDMKRRRDELHSTYCRCSEAFDIVRESCHSAMTTDCLPALKIICTSENLREETNTKRRFRHYLQANVLDASLLKSFSQTTNFVPNSSLP